ncbi:MAG: hypothetical protein U5K38_19240 [Woeseiaceae bacterium]|nr:hypothetical protein [Woeseiaceae bacterium]
MTGSPSTTANGISPCSGRKTPSWTGLGASLLVTIVNSGFMGDPGGDGAF